MLHATEWKYLVYRIKDKNSYRYSHKDNLILTDKSGQDAVIDSLKLFKKCGGGCIVENSTFGMNRNTQSLKRLSAESGIHIIAGTGKSRLYHEFMKNSKAHFI